MFTRGASVDLEKDGIMSVAIHPGWVLTELGGPNAAMDTEQSVMAVMGVIDNLKESSNGLVLDHVGTVIPW